MNTSGRKKQLPRAISTAIVNVACIKIGGPATLERKLRHPYIAAHLSKCRTGEEGLSKKVAKKLVKLIGETKPEWEAVLQ